MKKIISILFLAIATVTLTGCPNFDRDTFNTLAVSNSVLETAQVDYETGKLPHNTCVYTLINKGKTAQGVAESAFLDYYNTEKAKGDTTQLQSAVVTDLSAIAPIVASIKSIYSNPASCGV